MDFSFCQRFFLLLFYSHSMLRQLPENKHLLLLRLECLLQKELCSQPAFSVDPTPPWFRYFFSYLIHIPCGLSRKMDPLCYRSADTRLIPPVPLPVYKAVPGMVFFRVIHKKYLSGYPFRLFLLIVSDLIQDFRVVLLL